MTSLNAFGRLAASMANVTATLAASGRQLQVIDAHRNQRFFPHERALVFGGRDAKRQATHAPSYLGNSTLLLNPRSLIGRFREGTRRPAM
jgi:hypothetical protein